MDLPSYPTAATPSAPPAPAELESIPTAHPAVDVSAPTHSIPPPNSPVVGECPTVTIMCPSCEQCIPVSVPTYMERSCKISCIFCKNEFYFGPHPNSNECVPCSIL